MLILKEEEISLTSIAEHLGNAGIDTDSSKPDRITLHSDQGLGYHLFLDEDRKFIRLRTFLPIREGYLAAMDFSNELNQSVFLGSFAWDQDNDLLCSYDLSYYQGLIFGQLVRIIQRFASMLDHVREKGGDSVFDFDRTKAQQSTVEAPVMIH